MSSESIPRPPSASKKYWGGFSTHPFLEYLHPLLVRRGFRFSGYHQDGQLVTWNRPLFSGYDSQIWISPGNMSKKNPGSFGFTIVVSVVSSRQTEVEISARAWECLNLKDGNCAKKPLESTMIIRAFLNWLIWRWNPRVEDIDAGFYRWKSLETSRAEEVAIDVAMRFDQQGEDFIKLVETPIKLANVLLDLHNFPGMEFGGNLDVAPGSICPEEFAAVLLHDAELQSLAKAALETAVRRMVEEASKGACDARDIEIQKCKVERYLRWMQTGGIPQGAVQVEV